MVDVEPLGPEGAPLRRAQDTLMEFTRGLKEGRVVELPGVSNNGRRLDLILDLQSKQRRCLHELCQVLLLWNDDDDNDDHRYSLPQLSSRLPHFFVMIFFLFLHGSA